MTSSDAAAADSIVGSTLGGKYRVCRLLGAGGMGSVYEAEHLVTRQLGAFKLLHPRFAVRKDVVLRFVREASAAGRIQDPRIVQTFDAGTLPSGEPFIFMELLRGQPLSTLIDRSGTLPFERARELVAQAAEGLAAAHRNGIVHRDVKPENLFVCEGEPPTVKILDFGICKLAEEASEGVQRLTSAGAPMGTPFYMSHEQVVGADVDFRTDIYALGVVLYECLSGELPFHADTLPALAVKIFEGKYVKVSEHVAGLPPGTDELLARAMAVEPARRFPSMLAFREALLALPAPGRRSWASTELIGSAPPESPLASRSESITPRVATRRTLWVGALVVAAAAAAAAAALSQRERLESEPEPSASVPAEPPPSNTSTSPRAAPSVLPAPLVDSPAPAENDAKATPARAGTARPAQLPAASATRDSRAERDGLARDNPFR